MRGHRGWVEPIGAESGVAVTVAPVDSREKPLLGGIAMMLTGAVSNQTGAAIGAHAFPFIGPAGVVAVRQIVAAAVLVPVARPPFRRMTWHQWWPTLRR